MLAVCYPLLVFAGVYYQQLQWVAVLLAVVLLSRCIVVKASATGSRRRQQVLCGIGALLALMAAWSGNTSPMLYYPVIVNLTLLSVFGLSLKTDTPVITRIASLTTDLDDAGKRYTRRLTELWCVFFVINAVLALMTIHVSLEWWAVYNGIISYCLIGVLLTVEWIYRKLRLGQ
ncbi:hypothetical protein [Thaumasiovibrio sp. DFM-14]|uniref:COG4648 family protein n=1 Tax=Thaumasiovibrio sp. DFM-14 TaxID=3384792 RepID=UPI0039A2BFB0